jgi:hypothetical protein
MKKTIQELRNKLFSKEILSENDLLRLRGGDGEEDKRKGVGGNQTALASANEIAVVVADENSALALALASTTIV